MYTTTRKIGQIEATIRAIGFVLMVAAGTFCLLITSVVFGAVAGAFRVF